MLDDCKCWACRGDIEPDWAEVRHEEEEPEMPLNSDPPRGFLWVRVVCANTLGFTRDD